MDDASSVRPVVIVDDDEAIRTALRRLVRTIGYPVRMFENGEALLEWIGGAEPACVLTDIQMPGMSGLDLARELRGVWPNLPIAVMTAYPSLARRDAASAVRRFDYMEKPLDDRGLEAWLMEKVGSPRTG